MRATADQDQRENQLTHPRLGYGQVEENVVGGRPGVRGAIMGALGGVCLLIDKLATDLMFSGQVGHWLSARQDSDGQILSLRWE